MLGRLIIAALLASICSAPVFATDPMNVDRLERIEGFIDLYWDTDGGRLLLHVDQLDEPFLYQSSLARGIGSNDLGIDRGQLGATKLVRFVRSGPKVLLLEDNLAYRALSDNDDEQAAVDESFARSVIWGFEDLDASADSIIIDATDFLLRDAHGLGPWLAAAGEGSYAVDASRSAIYLPRTKGFVDNTEAEAIITLIGQPEGELLATVTPDPSAITVHMHHSFIRLPDNNYEPLEYDPRAGVIGLRYDNGGFLDYASTIGEPLSIDYGRRHRLQKKDPTSDVSEAVEPIIYYLDRGAPEPVRSALLDGARWWNEAFEAAGYKDAFQVQLLPEGADPMDVRYNVIQWVHRSTRGWSYGSSVLDPRSGEILKGHVSLGSLRVRQDYLIAEGLLSPYAGDSVPPEMLEMSLARIRQLSAHEVGHTIGFEHNFAASTQDRSSVMDYPFPRVSITDVGKLDLSDAYDDKIGSWDKRAVLYAYQDYADGVNAAAERQKILASTISQGYKYVADSDSRSVGTSHPDGNLWDNGADAIEELQHLLRVREIALQQFSERNIRLGRSMATTEEVLVPLFLLHRFQIKAVGKLIGGARFTYDRRGDGQAAQVAVDAATQRQAIDALVATLDPLMLRLADEIVTTISPRAPNDPKSRETFSGATGVNFDPISPAKSAVALTLEVLLDPSRAARLARSGDPGLLAVTEALMDATWYQRLAGGQVGAIQRQTRMQVIYALLNLALNPSTDKEVAGIALNTVFDLQSWLSSASKRDSVTGAHYRFAAFEIERLLRDPSQLELLAPAVAPPGSPIGSSQDFALQR